MLAVANNFIVFHSGLWESQGLSSELKTEEKKALTLFYQHPYL